MSQPTRKNAAGRAYLDLQNRARREKRPTQELLVLYALERWLVRLRASPYRDGFVLKGGVLLAVFDARRATLDADLLARGLHATPQDLVARVREIAVTGIPDDGVEFLPETITARVIREDHRYSGVRTTMTCRISTAKVKLVLDINVGDPVTPGPRLVELPSQRPGVPPVPVLGYPVETVIAEKTCTAVELGEGNTRVRDYADLYTLTGKQVLSYRLVRSALEVTAAYRGLELVALSAVTGDLAVDRQLTYQAFRERLGPDGALLPSSLADVVTAVVRFADPLLVGGVDVGTWDPFARRWGAGG